MKEVILDASLKLEEIKTTEPIKFNATVAKRGQETVRDCIYGTYRHKNYIGYLEMAWSKHYGVIISPDIIWYMILSEIAGLIKGDPEKYRDMFTTSEGKVEISVPTDDVELIDLDLIMEQLKHLVPTNTAMFLPEFSTSTVQSQMAFKAAFADAVTPFYNYSMYMCGISKVKILGTEEDWQKVIDGIIDLEGKFNHQYLRDLVEIVNNIKNCLTEPKVEEFLKDIFYIKKCGSGGQVEVKGWITKFYIEQPRPAYVENFSSHIALVPYTFLGTGKKYELCHGLFSSEIEDEYLVPDFGYIINEVKE